MPPCIVLLGVLFQILERKGAIASSAELRKHDAKLTFLTSKLETLQMEVSLVKDDLQDEINNLRESLDHQRQINAQILERLNVSTEFNIKEEKTSFGEMCYCPEIAILKIALQEIGTNVSGRIKILEENEKQKETIQESDKIMFAPQNREAAIVRAFGKEKFARKKSEAEISLKFLSIENKFSNISDECRSHQPKFNETMIAHQRMNESLRSLTVQVDGIQSSLTVLKKGQDKLFLMSDQLNGSSNSLSLEITGIKSSLKVLMDTQEQLSSKSDEMSRLLANISLEMKKIYEQSQKENDILKIKLKLLEAGITCSELITEGEKILKSLKFGSRVVHGGDLTGGNQDKRLKTAGTVRIKIPRWTEIYDKVLVS
ncbi:hypothetical protein CHS0354_008993 [Potamilus streckersoni]|uniref:Uncharacterized protein n=1 Tax=Potamilus streckersoni TaxID=2493646 RepID=A0AAE0THR1_9BIVA|nr:hypothetical protein CHS0354_008993 [Potamilus streckersoni]